MLTYGPTAAEIIEYPRANPVEEHSRGIAFLLKIEIISDILRG